MNILRKVALGTARKMAGWATGQTVDTTSPALASWFGTHASYTGKSVNDMSALQVSTVWACNRILAEGRGQLPVAVYERTVKDGKEDLQKVDHDLSEVLVSAPNADMTANEYAEARMLNLGLRGSAYSFVERNASGSRIESLYPIQSRNCRVMRRLDGREISAETCSEGELCYQVNDRGRWEKYPKEKIWHQRIFSLDGVNGLSPIGYARETIGFSMGLEEFGARIFSQGLHPGMVMKTAKWLDPEQRKQAQTKLEALWGGLVNAGRPFVLEGGMDLVPGHMPPKDAEFLGLRGYGVNDICRFYLVSPHRVAQLEQMTNNNIEQLSLEFVMYTLLPYIVKEERSADRWLFNARDRGKYVVRCNYDGLLRGDSEARSKLESVWLQNGVVTRNEVRALERLRKSDADGMDDFTVQSNMISVADLMLVADALRKNRDQGASV